MQRRLSAGVVSASLIGLTLLAGVGLGPPPGRSPAAMPASRPVAGLDPCSPMGPPTGAVIDVAPSQAPALPRIVADAHSGDTVRFADGTYALNGVTLWMQTPGVTLRGASGDRERVVLDGAYASPEIIGVMASNVTIADLTIRRAYNHLIHAQAVDADVTGLLMHNLHLVDGAQQQVKINPNGHYVDRGTLRCSRLELTDAGRGQVRDSCYTGGIDGHQAQGWVVSHNTFSGFWCNDGLSEHAVHFWTGSRDTLVDANVILNSARGVGFGLEQATWRVYPDNPCPGAGQIGHVGGVIRNNFIAVTDARVSASPYGFDTGIGLEHACRGPVVVHNSVASTQPPASSSIEWRFVETDAVVKNNIGSGRMIARDGGSADGAANLDNASLDHFVDAGAGDLHLAASATDAIKHGVPLAAGVCDYDIDGDLRAAPPDIGADERTQVLNAPPGAYNPLAPARLLDTRTSAQVGSDASIDLQVAGQGGVPAGGAVAAVLNVTVTGATASSYVTLYPAGPGGRPLASNLNFMAGQTVANLTEVALGQGGKVSIYNAAGAVDVIVDVQGYVAGTGPAGLFQPLDTPTRLLDTRLAGHPLSPDSSLQLQVPGTGVGAAVLNVTAVDGTAPSYLTVYPGTGTRPLASNLNFPSHRNLPNRVTVKVGPGGQVSIYNSEGTVDVVVDLSGTFTDGTVTAAAGGLFHPLAPARILDTRLSSPLGPGATLVLPVAGHGGVPPSGATAVLINMTVTNPSAGSFLTVFPAGASPPLASDLNFGPLDTIPNVVVVRLGPDGALRAYNNLGSTDLLADVSGWYG